MDEPAEPVATRDRPAAGRERPVGRGWARLRVRRRTRADRGSRLQAPARVLGTVGTAAAVVGLLGHTISWPVTPLLAVAVLTPYLVLGAPVGAVLLLLGRAPARAGLALVLTVLAVLTEAPLFVATTAPPGADIVVMTANLRLGHADAAQVVAAARSHHADVVMLEEVTPGERRALRGAGLDRLLPHSEVDARGDATGTGLWSRYPLSDAVRRHDFYFALVTARVRLPQDPGRTVVLVAAHMTGPVPTAGQWLADIDHLPHLLQSLPAAMPALVGGDFNASLDTGQFRDLLTGGYADATDQAGAGFVATWPADHGPTPLVALDHVLTRHAVARTVGAVQIAGTDHRALVATVRLVPPAASGPVRSRG